VTLQSAFLIRREAIIYRQRAADDQARAFTRGLAGVGPGCLSIAIAADPH
jgi:hypothetical protein